MFSGRYTTGKSALRYFDELLKEVETTFRFTKNRAEAYKTTFLFTKKVKYIKDILMDISNMLYTHHL